MQVWNFNYDKTVAWTIYGTASAHDQTLKPDHGNSVTLGILVSAAKNDLQPLKISINGDWCTVQLINNITGNQHVGHICKSIAQSSIMLSINAVSGQTMTFLCHQDILCSTPMVKYHIIPVRPFPCLPAHFENANILVAVKLAHDINVCSPWAVGRSFLQKIKSKGKRCRGSNLHQPWTGAYQAATSVSLTFHVPSCFCEVITVRVQNMQDVTRKVHTDTYPPYRYMGLTAGQ